MTREELITSPVYWTFEIQNDLFQLIENYLKENNLSRIQFAEKLGVTKGYVSQILNGEFDHRISKFVELAMKVGKVPRIEFEDLEQILIDDMYDSLHKPKNQRPIITLQINTNGKSTLDTSNTKKTIVDSSKASSSVQFHYI